MKKTQRYEIWLYDDSMSSLGYPATEGVLRKGLTKAEAKSIARHYNRVTTRMGIDIFYSVQEEGTPGTL